MSFFTIIYQKITRRFTGFEAITWAAILIIASNAIYEITSSESDILSFKLLLVAVALLLVSILLARLKYFGLALFISLSTGNAIIFWINYRLGTDAGALLYYFPFIISFLFVFRTESNHLKLLGYVTLFIITIVLTILVCKPVSDHDAIPHERLREIYYTCLVSSIILTIVFILLIYYYQNRMNRKVLGKLELRRKKVLKYILETQEKERQKLVEELRDNINQILVSGMKMLEMADSQKPENKFIKMGYKYAKSAVEHLNSLCVKLSPAMISDIGLSEGLMEYANTINKMKGVEIVIQNDYQEIESIALPEKLSVYRIIQDCVELLVNKSGAKDVSIGIDMKDGFIEMRFTHKVMVADIIDAKENKDPEDLRNRIDYFNGQINQQPGLITLVIPVTELITPVI